MAVAVAVFALLEKWGHKHKASVVNPQISAGPSSHAWNRFIQSWQKSHRTSTLRAATLSVEVLARH